MTAILLPFPPPPPREPFEAEYLAMMAGDVDASGAPIMGRIIVLSDWRRLAEPRLARAGGLASAEAQPALGG